VAGRTYLRSGYTQTGFYGMIATDITTGYEQAGFALQHEIGHAVEVVAREAAQKTAYQNFDAAIENVRQELRSKGAMIRRYAKDYDTDGEAFAESYANYYCSPSSHAFIKNNLPYTYGFLSAVLAPPVWKQQDTGAAIPVRTSPQAGSVFNASRLKVQAEVRRDASDYRYSTFRLTLQGNRQDLSQIANVVFKIHPTFGSSYPHITAAADGSFKSGWYKTYARGWATEGTFIYLKNGRVIAMPGAAVN
jgi:hypothetical protein